MLRLHRHAYKPALGSATYAMPNGSNSATFTNQKFVQFALPLSKLTGQLYTLHRHKYACIYPVVRVASIRSCKLEAAFFNLGCRAFFRVFGFDGTCIIHVRQMSDSYLDDELDEEELLELLLLWLLLLAAEKENNPGAHVNHAV